MSTGYRGIFYLDATQSALDVAETQFREWLHEKEYPSDLELSPNSVTKRDDKSVLAIAEIQDKKQTARLYELSEDNQGRTWIVKVYAFSSSLEPSTEVVLIQVDVSVNADENPIDLVDPPRIASKLLSALKSNDGSVEIFDGVRSIDTIEDLNKVVQDLLNPKRQITINVAPSPGSKYENEWLQVVQSLVRKGQGNSSTYILNEKIVSKFNSQLVGPFKVELGYVRSYVPGVDLLDPGNALRHRFLKPETLAASFRKTKGKFSVSQPLQRAFNVSTRQRFVQQELPSSISTLINRLDIALVQVWKESVRSAKVPTQAKSPTPSRTELDSEVEKSVDLLEQGIGSKIAAFLYKFIGKATVSVESIAEVENLFEHSASEMQVYQVLLAEADRSEHQARERTNQANDQVARTRTALETERYRVRQLEYENKRLRENQEGNFGGQLSEDFREDQPFNLEDLISRLVPNGPQKWEWLRDKVVYTGNAKPAIDLDSKADAQLYLESTWVFIEVLHDYVLAKTGKTKFQGDVDSYLRNPSSHSGLTTGTGNHSPMESQQIKERPKYFKPRTLPVPKEVNKNGEALMLAHFKIDTSDTIAPRLHYLDDTSRTGKVYIGYIGKHLVSPETN